MKPDAATLASLPPDALRTIEEQTEVSLEGLDIIAAAKLGSAAGRNAIELELRIDVSGAEQREAAATQLRCLADRLCGASDKSVG